jgi:DNA-binding XRE family transcriptional regulator
MARKAAVQRHGPAMYGSMYLIPKWKRSGFAMTTSVHEERRAQGGDNMKTELQKYLYGRGITQTYVARQLGITPQSLGRKIKGRLNFTWTEVMCLCDVLSVEVQDITMLIPQVLSKSSRKT